MNFEEEDIGNNRIEDVNWLCTLFESELDMLICLKNFALQRAKVTGYNELANKFNLKVLRALGFILLEYLKERMKDLPAIPSLTESADFLDGCNLLNCNLNNTINIEELKACIKNDSRKRKAERYQMGSCITFWIFGVRIGQLLGNE